MKKLERIKAGDCGQYIKKMVPFDGKVMTAALKQGERTIFESGSLNGVDKLVFNQDYPDIYYIVYCDVTPIYWKTINGLDYITRLNYGKKYSFNRNVIIDALNS